MRGDFIFVLIVAVELMVLLRLSLPRILACGQAKYDAFYGVAHGDVPAVPTISNPIHDTGDTL